MLIGNKKDLDEHRDVSFEEAQKFAEENGLFPFVIFFTKQAFYFWNPVRKRKPIALLRSINIL